MSLCTDYSGIVVNQNEVVASPTHRQEGVAYQGFFLPTDFMRDTVVPGLSGVQVYAAVADVETVVAWAIERYIVGTGWVTLLTGSTTGAPFVGDQWLNLFFDQPLVLAAGDLSSRYRIRIDPGAASLYFSSPNPLDSPVTPSLTNRAYTDGSANLELGASPILDPFHEVSLRFRILATTADTGIDVLGNQYRSAAVRQDLDNASTLTGARGAFWLSGPQPSRFAVVSNYFDVRQGGVAQVVDRILIDPLTPNVFFQVYYSNENVDPTGFAPEDWDDLLWTHVPATFQARRRETHALPSPISANFIKIEFSHLQARQYAPGDFAKPIAYNKHPKWVLDYFLLRSALDDPTDDHFVATAVAVTFGALDLAYNYYLDDLRQGPDVPAQLTPDSDSIKSFLGTLDDASDSVDQATLNLINTTLNQWRANPSAVGKLDYLPSTYTRATGTTTATYPVEGGLTSLVNRDSSVSVLDREPVIVEQGYPVMFFFIECRHVYRKVQATLDQGIAYFVGINEIQFDRDLYSTTADTSLYTDLLSDGINADVNDFLRPDFSGSIVRT